MMTNYSYYETEAGYKIDGKTNEDIVMAGGGTRNHFTKEDSFFHSARNFPNGTLIETDVDYSQDNGDQFLLEIKGNMSDNNMPLDAKIQGYIYNASLINVAAYTTCYYWKIITALNYNGKLCFWFPQLSYWQGFDVKLTVGYGGIGQGQNRVTNVSDSADPGGTKRVSIYLKTLATQEYVNDNFATIQNLNNYQPLGQYVRIGGDNTTGNNILLGWTGTQAQLTVDATTIGNLWHSGNFNPSNFFSNDGTNTLKTITSSNFNDVIDGQGKIWLGDIYNLPTSDTGLDSIYGTILNINGLVAHDKTQLIFNGQNGSIQYRKSFYPNSAWTALRTLWDNSNLPNPVDQSQLGNYLTIRSGQDTALIAKTDFPLSITDYVGDPALTNFQSYYGTSFHFKGGNTWYNRLDFPVLADKIFLYQGINTTDMTLRGSIDIIPTGVTNWTSNNLMYVENSSKLYSTDPQYGYDGIAPYFGFLSYNNAANRWRFEMSPATPKEIEVAYSDNAGALGGVSAGSYVLQSNLNTQLGNYATLAGTQTFSGTNTFDQNIVIPFYPTLLNHATSYGFVADYVDQREGIILNYVAATYMLKNQVATSNVLGGIRLITDTVNNIAPNAVTTVIDRSYAVQLNNLNQAVVNVPWIDYGNHATVGYAKLAGDPQTFSNTNIFTKPPRVPSANNPDEAIPFGQATEIAISTVRDNFLTRTTTLPSNVTYDLSNYGSPMMTTIVIKGNPNGELYIDGLDQGMTIKIMNTSALNLIVRFDGGSLATGIGQKTWIEVHRDSDGDLIKNDTQNTIII